MAREKEQLPFNPFDPVALQKGGFFSQIFAFKKMQKQAEERFKRTLEMYHDMLLDPRYSEILKETEVVLGEQIRLIVEKARRGENCHAEAERVTLLMEIIRRPAEALYIENYREKFIPPPQEEEEVAG